MHRDIAAARTKGTAAKVLVLALALVAATAWSAGVASAADTTPPTEPGVISVSAITATSATLRWSKSTDDVRVEGYRVYRGPASAADSALSLVKSMDAATPYSATQLFSGAAYKFG